MTPSASVTSVLCDQMGQFKRDCPSIQDPDYIMKNMMVWKTIVLPVLLYQVRVWWMQFEQTMCYHKPHVKRLEITRVHDPHAVHYYWFHGLIFQQIAVWKWGTWHFDKEHLSLTIIGANMPFPPLFPDKQSCSSSRSLCQIHRGTWLRPDKGNTGVSRVSCFWHVE